MYSRKFIEEKQILASLLPTRFYQNVSAATPSRKMFRDGPLFFCITKII